MLQEHLDRGNITQINPSQGAELAGFGSGTGVFSLSIAAAALTTSDQPSRHRKAQEMRRDLGR